MMLYQNNKCLSVENDLSKLKMSKIMKFLSYLSILSKSCVRTAPSPEHFDYVLAEQDVSESSSHTDGSDEPPRPIWL